jgi:dTDP-4-dehydrorhamnose reductase
VIHAQALSDVDQCERDPHLAEASNVTTTANVVQAARAVGAWLLSVSTDYVFDGAVGRPYDERDATNPVSVYGKSKLEGERVALGYPRSVVVRPSTLFGPGRMNFCDRVVTAANAGQPVPAFVDQVTSPTYTMDLAEALVQFAQRLLVCGGPDDLPSRIFHMANAGRCSRLEFAHRIVDLLGQPRDLVQAVRLADERRAAPRPAFSALTSRYLTEVIGRTLRPWDEALEAYLQ